MVVLHDAAHGISQPYCVDRHCVATCHCHGSKLNREVKKERANKGGREGEERREEKSKERKRKVA